MTVGSKRLGEIHAKIADFQVQYHASALLLAANLVALGSWLACRKQIRQFGFQSSLHCLSPVLYLMRGRAHEWLTLWVDTSGAL